MEPANKQVFVFHDRTCKREAQAVRQALELEFQRGKSAEDALFVVLYRDKKGYEEAMGPVSKLKSPYPILAVPIDRSIEVDSGDAAVFVPYDFELIKQTADLLQKQSYAGARLWQAFLVFLLIVMLLAPFAYSFSCLSGKLGTVELIVAGIMHLSCSTALLIYLAAFSQSLRQRISIDRLKLRVLGLNDLDQKKKANERIFDFYLEETEKQ